MNDRPAWAPDGYEVLQSLGQGRTSIVWLARDLAAQREVALKLPRPLLRTDATLRRMFENEVQITLKLDHPHVVRAYAGRSTSDDAFLALEYCAGGTLDQLLLERGRLPLETATRLVHEVAMGLAHTHDRRVLHRDVKPANVFIDGDGHAKLGDFGTGTFQTDDVTERVGTAFYMAPEVFEGRPTSVRSDVYSLGVLAYEVLAGERPFVGASYDELMFAHMHSLPRDLRAVRPELPSTVPRVVSRALSRDPGRRFPDVTAFLVAYRDAIGFVSPEAAVGRDPTLGRNPTLPKGPAVGRNPTIGRTPAPGHDPKLGRTPAPGRDVARRTDTEGPAGPAPAEAPRRRFRWWPFGRR